MENLQIDETHINDEDISGSSVKKFEFIPFIRKYQKFLIIAFVVGVFVISMVFLLIKLSSRNDFPIDVASDVYVHHIVDEPSSGDLFNSEESEVVGIEATPSVFFKESTESFARNNMKPAIFFKEPVVSANSAGYILYSYAINFNESAYLKYSKGIMYDLVSKNCKLLINNKANILALDSDTFSGKLVNIVKGYNTITLRIRHDFIDLDNKTEGSTYVAYDLDGNYILSGNVSVPRCKSIIEYKDKVGGFKINGPAIDLSTKSGYSIFRYGFVIDDDAKAFLRKGFALRVNHNCSGWLSGDPFNKHFNTLDEGISFNIDNDGFDKLTASFYEVYDLTGDLIYQGLINVPSCR